MLPNQPSYERRALNRVTFGARDLDEKYAQTIGWTAWVNEQLAAPPGDDPDLAAFLAGQTMHIEYAAAPDTSNGTWPAVKEDRPLVALAASTEALWSLYAGNGTSVPSTEIFRVRQELAAASWIRNAHARYQLREFMTDFWHNHFNIGKTAHETATVELPVYDRDVIRPNVFGNFRELLRATARSTSMQIYLDNWLSRATTPNENYAREVLELHTLGADVYLGIVNSDPPSVQAGPYTVTAGFTDADITQASRALSGWTVANGQFVRGGQALPRTGEFAYDPAMHNTAAGMFMGNDLSKLTADMAQGYRVLDIAAYHPATARFICKKLCIRIFGEDYPEAVYTRAYNAWMSSQDLPNQIAQVLRAILIGGSEIGTQAATKLRRPYEHLIALFRASDMIVNAGTTMTSAFDPVSDFLFAWAPPNGRPDVNSYWLTTGALLAMWNNALTWPSNTAITTSLTAQTPDTAKTSVSALVEYWVGRMVGYSLSSGGMSALTSDSSIAALPNQMRNPNVSATTIEKSLRRLVGLIAQSPEFVYR